MAPYLTILIVAILCRAIGMVALQDGCFLKGEVCGPPVDQKEYLGLAENLIGGRGFTLDSGYLPAGKPYTYRPPLYPLFAGIVLGLGDGNLVFLRGVQILLTLIIPLCMYPLGLCFLRKEMALALGILSAASPFFFYFGYLFLSDFLYETLFIAAFAILMVSIRKSEGRAKEKGLLWASLLMGLGALTRGELFYFHFLVIGFLLVKWLQKNLRTRSLVLYMVIFFTVVGLWMARNSYHYGRFMGIQGKIASLAILISYRGYYTGYQWPELEACLDRVQKKAFQMGAEDRVDRYVIREMVHFAMQHPAKFLYVTGIKMAGIWKLYPREIHAGGLSPYVGFRYRLMSFVFYVLWIPLALWGLFLLAKSSPWEVVLMAGLMLVVTAGIGIFNEGIRHRVILMPFFYLFALFALEKSLLWLKRAGT